MKRLNTRRKLETDQPIIMLKEESSYLPGLDLGLNQFSDSSDPRTIWFTNEVYPETVASIVQQIHDINYQDARSEKEAELNGQTFTRLPIKLYISSYGGSVYDGLGLVGVIRTSKTPVHTYTFGKVMSMGFVLAISGHKRFTYPHTTYMYHSLSSVHYGKFADLQESVEEDERLQSKLDNFTTTVTKINQETLNSVHKHKADWYLDAEEALVNNCVDEIIV